MIAACVAAFAAGDSVPEWLLAVEPQPGVADPRPGRVTFAVPVKVFEVDVGYVVFPDTAEGFRLVIRWDGSSGCAVGAGSRTVYLVTSCQRLHGPDEGPAPPGFGGGPVPMIDEGEAP